MRTWKDGDKLKIPFYEDGRFYDIAPTDIPDYSTKENAYKRLVLQRFPYITEYNTANPPQKNLDQALATMREYEESEHLIPGLLIAGLVAFVLGYLPDTSKPLNPVFGVRITSVTTLDVARLFFCIFALCMIAAIVAYFKKDKTAPSRAENLRKPLPLYILSDTNRYSCCGKLFHVIVTYESSRPFSAESTLRGTKDQFTRALDEKIHLTLKHWFEAFEATYRDDPHNDLTSVLPDLRDNLEGLMLPRICEICHDFQPEVFRYQVTVHTVQETSDGIVPIGEPC